MYLTYLFGESGDFISLELWTSIFTLCNLVILFFVMKKLLFKPVKKMIDSRQQEVDDMYANANQDKEAAAQMKTEYEEKLAERFNGIARFLNGEVRVLPVCNTLQVDDYSKYAMSGFDEALKQHVHQTQFPRELEAAYQLGARFSA